MYFLYSIKKIHFIGVILLLLNVTLKAQKPTDFIPTQTNNYGTLENAATLQSVFKITNPTNKNLFILRAKGSRFVTVNYSYQAIAPSATDSIVVKYQPQSNGAFKEEVEVVLTALPKPIILVVEGVIKNYNQDFLTQCIRFGEAPTAFTFVHKGTVLDAETGKPIANAEVVLEELSRPEGTEFTDRKGTYTRQVRPGLYDFTASATGYYPREVSTYINPQKPDVIIRLEPIKTQPLAVAEPEEIIIPTPPVPKEPEVVKPTNPQPNKPNPPAQPVALPGQLSYDLYKSNNVVFLIDISGSMRDSLKLPLLKESMLKLAKALRPTDRLTLLTYADGVTTRFAGVNGGQYPKIEAEINALKASGGTEGGKGLKKAYKMAQSNFIEGGNNQIIMSTDGEFSNLGGTADELEKLVAENKTKGIVLSVVGFGKKKYALQTMEKLATTGGGSYTYIATRTDGIDALLNEVMLRSKK